MDMNKLGSVAVALTLTVTLFGCPTRPGPNEDDGGGTSSTGGHPDSGGNAGTSVATGGSSGGGKAGTAGGGGGGLGGIGLGGGAGRDGTGGAGGGAAGTAGGVGGAAAGTGGSSGGAKDGQPCSVPSDCASDVCSPFYVDVDGDGYGTGQATGFCGTTPPVGYAAQSGDCCDNATNLMVAKLIHPGADFQTTSAGGVCGITWDYDCSGMVEKNFKQCSSCNSDPCGCNYTDFPDSDCGTNQGGSCGLFGAPTQTCSFIVGGVGPVGCR